MPGLYTPPVAKRGYTRDTIRGGASEWDVSRPFSSYARTLAMLAVHPVRFFELLPRISDVRAPALFLTFCGLPTALSWLLLRGLYPGLLALVSPLPLSIVLAGLYHPGVLGGRYGYVVTWRVLAFPLGFTCLRRRPGAWCRGASTLARAHAVGCGGTLGRKARAVLFARLSYRVRSGTISWACLIIASTRVISGGSSETSNPRDHIGPRRSRGSETAAVTSRGCDQFDLGCAVFGSDVAHLLHQELAHPGPSVALRNDEHRHLDDGVAVGEVGFDPEARPSHDPGLVLGDENPRPWFVQELLEPRPDDPFRRRRVADRLGQLPARPQIRRVLDFASRTCSWTQLLLFSYSEAPYPEERCDDG